MRFIPIPEVRRGLGGIFMASGVFHAVVTAWACLITAGLTRQSPPMGWGNLYFAHFVFTWVTAASFVFKKSRQGDLFAFQILLDFLAGYLPFWMGFKAVARMLAAHWLPPSLAWLALAPSLFLIYYGAVLARGRQVWPVLDI